MSVSETRQDGTGPASTANAGSTSTGPSTSPSTGPSAEALARRYATETRLLAIDQAARHHGIDIDRETLRYPAGEAPSPATLVGWLRDGGLWAKAVRLRWAQAMRLEVSSPVVLLLKDGGAAVLTTIDSARNIMWLKDPRGASGDLPVAVDELRLSQVWDGEVMLIRPERGVTEELAPFNVAWLWRIVAREKNTLRDILIASLALSVLAIVPALIVMQVIDKVLTYHSMSTLFLISLILGVCLIYEGFLTFARMQMTLIIGARVDAKLSLHVFRRLLGLPLDYFERQQAGVITHYAMQVNKVREFLSGRMLTLMLDLITLAVLLPVLFMLQPTLTWLVIICAGLIGVIIVAFLGPTSRAIGKWIQAETQKNSVLIESIHGIRTVKSLALEPQQRELWDRRTADSARAKLDAGRLAAWPAALVLPIEHFMIRGVILIGVLMALKGGSDINPGTLMAFMMLSARVGQPLSGLARIMEDFQEVRVAVALAGSVLNQKPESVNPGAGMRPRLEGAITFSSVNYSYPGSKTKALDGVTFDVPAGTMLGLVGRSGSGKSTITRLLQGITRDFEGFLKLDGTDLREINLAHMRRSFGVVLQENFLFRGSVRENILAGRPGLTLSDAVRAARLAGAEEFIERMPNGYETWIEEGSPNLSGGQRQRLAIARALVHDPKLLILDEATSALDPESEALVNANLQRIARGRTMVIVSHRLSSLTDCDKILVLDQGRVIDIGPHIELVERCTIYRGLWLQQNRHLETGGMPRGSVPATIVSQA